MRRQNVRAAGVLCQYCAPRNSPALKPPFATVFSVAIPQNVSHGQRTSRRWATTTAATRPNDTMQQGAAASGSRNSPAATASKAQATRELTNPSHLAALVEDGQRKFFSVDGIPAKQLTTAALESCLRAASALHPQLRRVETRPKASSSRLMTLGGERTGTKPPIDATLKDAANRISHAAYTIITHPNVEMTPEFLELYVNIQAMLGRPESLPSVLELYASKPKPVIKNGEVQYVPQKPNTASRAIEPQVADLAVDTAIGAKNLDAALGIIEASYVVPAFKRQKLIKQGTAPFLGLATLPFGIFGVATAYAAYWQNTMDMSTATGLAVAGVSGYFFVVGSLGVIAKLSYKDHMKRVTWTPGTPLRYRWLREEERAALDKVACAWGFKESWRHGEETGPEWEGLKEYMGYRQMLLDRVEFMEGMS